MKPILSSIVFFLVFSIQAQSILEKYIEKGLSENLALQQKKASYQQSLYELKEAKGMYFPSVTAQARYTVADGGRIIEFPVGDLLNPVYNTLNMPLQLENQSFNFYRPQEHETKLQLIQPLFNPALTHNKKIHQYKSEINYLDAESYKRYLVAEIKKTYYNYLKSKELIDILSRSEELSEENLRVNKALYQQQKVTLDHVHRSQAETGKIEAKKAEAVKQYQSVAAYFNFLINSDPSDTILTDTSLFAGYLSVNPDSANYEAGTKREELMQFSTASQLKNQQIKLSESSRLPTVTAIVDYGYQGEEYRFTGNDDFILASVVLRWDLFKGYQNKNRIQQSIIQKDAIDKQKEETGKKIQLQVITAYYDVIAAQKKVVAKEKEYNSNKSCYNTVRKKHQQGQVSQIEYLDAFNTYEISHEELVIARYDYLISLAHYEYVTASYFVTK
jgi:outer membrane protein TolC